MRNRRIFVYTIIVFLVLSNCFLCANAKNRPTQGRFNKSKVMWSYNKKTGTMTIGPSKKKIKKVNYKAFVYWRERTKRLVHKKGMKDLWVYYNSDGGEYYNTSLESIYLPGSLKRVESGAFDAASALKKVTISQGIEYVGNGAFTHSRLSQVELPKGMKYVGRRAFGGSYGFGSESIKLNDELEYIGYSAFDHSSAQDVIIPDSVSYIGPFAFECCYSLKSVRLPRSLRTLEMGVFRFDKCIENVELPESLITIKDRAFSFSGLHEITIPRNVEILGNPGDDYGIFRDCTNLKKIRIESKKLKTIYKGALSGMPEGVIVEVPKGYGDIYKAMFSESGLSDNYRITEIDIDGNDESCLQLNRENIVVKKGLERKIEILYADYPENITWGSSDETVASVDKNGIVTGNRIGKSVITAEYKGIKYECSVEVIPNDSNNDVKALKKLIKEQSDFDTCFRGGLYTSRPEGHYEWENGRLIGIDWSNTYVHGYIDLNEFTYLEWFKCEGEEPCVIGIDADNLKHLKYICYNEDIPEENIRVENSKDVKIQKVEVE